MLDPSVGFPVQGTWLRRQAEGERPGLYLRTWLPAILAFTLPLVMQTKSKPKRVKALYNCMADNPDELTFSEGDVIIVDGEEDQEWWVSRGEGPVSLVSVSCVGLICPQVEYLTIMMGRPLGLHFKGCVTCTESFEAPGFHMQPFTARLWSKASRELSSRVECLCRLESNTSYRRSSCSWGKGGMGTALLPEALAAQTQPLTGWVAAGAQIYRPG